MQRKWIVYLSLAFLGTFSASSSLEGVLQKREQWISMKTTIIIPCHYRHFQHVYDLLVHYENQSVLPDEVVISLSESQNVPRDQIERVMNEPWAFSVTILESSEKLTASQNRNLASLNSTGDLLICQDADDLPHPQRVEIIHTIFEQFEVEHLLHYWIRPQEAFSFYKSEAFENFSTYCKTYRQAKLLGGITNGNNAYTREVFNRIQWPEQNGIGEDVSFNNAVYKSFKYKVVVKAPLLMYRNELSSFSSLE